MNKLDKILDNLASQKPKLNDADALCDSIMDSLPEQHRQESHWIGILRWSTSIAATFFLMLFIGQNINNEVIQGTSSSVNFATRYQQTINEVANASSVQEAILQFAKKKETQISIYNIKKQYSL